jgi:hypothetical protein
MVTYGIKSNQSLQPKELSNSGADEGCVRPLQVALSLYFRLPG